MQVPLHHELKQHAHGLLPHAHTQQAHDVRVTHLGHEVHLAAEVILHLGGGVLLEGLDGYLGDTVVPIQAQ